MPPSFVYVLFDPREPDHIRYVGKANSPYDRYKGHLREATQLGRNSKKLAWMRKCALSSVVVSVLVVEQCMTEQDAYIAERWWIDHLKNTGHRLTNLSDGGEGWATSPWLNPAVAEKLRLSAQSRAVDPKFIEQVTDHFREYWSDEKHRDEQSARLTAYFSDQSARDKTSRATKKAMEDPKVRERISSRVKTVLAQPEVRDRMISARWSDEQRQAQRETAKQKMSDPRVRKNLSEKVTKQWEDPAYRESHTRWWKDNPEKAQALAQKQRDLWKDDNYRDWRRVRIAIGRRFKTAQRNGWVILDHGQLKKS